MAKGERPEVRREAGSATTLLRSLGEGVRTIITVTERLSDLRAESVTARADLNRLSEMVYRIAGRLDEIDKRFAEIDKRIDLAVKFAVREEVERLKRENGQ